MSSFGRKQRLGGRRSKRRQKGSESSWDCAAPPLPAPLCTPWPLRKPPLVFSATSIPPGSGAPCGSQPCSGTQLAAGRSPIRRQEGRVIPGPLQPNPWRQLGLQAPTQSGPGARGKAEERSGARAAAAGPGHGCSHWKSAPAETCASL